MTTIKQIFELMLTQQLWAFDEEDFERMFLVFTNTFSEWLQQKQPSIIRWRNPPYEKHKLFELTIIKNFIDELLDELKGVKQT